MKKILFPTLISLVLIYLLLLSGCETEIGFLDNEVQSFGCGGSPDIDIDNLPTHTYSIYAGAGGIIYRSVNDNNNIVLEQKNSGTTEDLNAVAVRNRNTWAFAVGNNGVIVRTTNEGNNWSLMPKITSDNLFSASFGFSGFQFAVGNNGTILRSSNLGSNWSVSSSGTTRNLKAVSEHAAGEKVVAAGEKGTILRSTTSGFNWINVSIADTTIDFNCINNATCFGIEIENFYIAGTHGKLYKSTNRGATWESKSSGTTHTLRSIYFINDDSGVVVGDSGTIRFTSNAGESWYSDPFFDSNWNRQYKTVALVNPDFKTFSALSDTIWFASADPITIGTSSLELNLSALIEGFYDHASKSMISDTVNVYLRNTVSPFEKVDSAKGKLSSSGNGIFYFSNATNGSLYYLEIVHRNSIETWSKTSEQFTASVLSYDFTTANTQAYGDNMIQIDSSPVKYGIYSGDVNQDGTIDLADGSLIDNDAFNFASGYLSTDVNGDGTVDLADAVFADNNGFNFVSKITP